MVYFVLDEGLSSYRRCTGFVFVVEIARDLKFLPKNLSLGTGSHPDSAESGLRSAPPFDSLTGLQKQ